LGDSGIEVQLWYPHDNDPKRNQLNAWCTVYLRWAGGGIDYHRVPRKGYEITLWGDAVAR
jgi:hypothetical protein